MTAGMAAQVPFRNDASPPSCRMYCGRQLSAWTGTALGAKSCRPEAVAATSNDQEAGRPAPPLCLGGTLKSHPNFRTPFRDRSPHTDCAAAPLPLGPVPLPAFLSTGVDPRAPCLLITLPELALQGTYTLTFVHCSV